MSRRARKVTEFSAFTVQAGTHPVPDVRDPDGRMAPRLWQAEGYAALTGARRRILLAPTGSGKSTLIKVLAAEDLRDPRAKVVIAVPQVVIARSFGDVPQGIRCGDRVVTWQVGHNLVGGNGRAVDALMAFVRSKPASDAAGRTLVCSHQTLVFAHQRLLSAAKGKRSPWAGVSLFIDEAHHSRAEDADDGGDDANAEDGAERLNNRLGQLVAHWLDRDPGALLLATATWLRANLAEIVPAGRMGDFTKYILTMEKHLEGMNHLREVAFRFLIGAPSDALQAIYDEGNAKTIAWLPHVASSHMREFGDKHSALEAFEGAIGDVVGVDDWTTTLQHKPVKGRRFDVRALDFVTLAGRDDRRDALGATIDKWASKIREAEAPYLKAIKDKDEAKIAATRKATLAVTADAAADSPDLLWALGMGKEGFDWPELSRAIVIGERGSIPDVLQMMGRTMRDYPGKARAEFNMVLPYVDGADPENVRAYLKTILASMVIESGFCGTWPWRRAKANSGADAGEREATAGVDGAADAVAAGEARAAGDVGADAGTVAADAPASADAGAVAADGGGDAGGDVDALSRAVEVIDGIVDRVIRDPKAEANPDAVIDAALSGAGVPEGERGEAKRATRRMFADWTRRLAEIGDVPVDVTESVLGCVRMLGLRFGFKTLADLREALGQKPNMTEEQILEWAEEHREKTGEWPSCRTGAVRGHDGETWVGIDLALRHGYRGLTEGLSLAKLLASLRDDRLSEAKIIVWAEEHREKTGKLPSAASGAVHGHDGEVWGNINSALHCGLRGLQGGSSLARLLGRGAVAKGDLTEAKILTWADEHFALTGKWPNETLGTVYGHDGETWTAIAQALRAGHRGLPGGSSLLMLLGLTKDDLTEEQIRGWAEEHYARTGKWPNQKSGHVYDHDGETWAAINAAIRHGRRGLRGGSSLSQLLAPLRDAAPVSTTKPTAKAKARRGRAA